MGYFSNMFVFGSQPAWESVANAFPGVCIRGYRPKQGSEYLLDLWKPSNRATHFPFQWSINQGYTIEPIAKETLNGATQEFLVRLASIAKAVKPLLGFQQYSEVHRTLRVAQLTGLPVFGFAGNDEDVDVACHAEPDRIVHTRVMFGSLIISFVDGITSVVPRYSEEDGNEDEVEELESSARTVAGVQVLAKQSLEGGRTLYESATTVAPEFARAACTKLGIGTWDPCLELEQHYEVTFERLI